MGNLIGPKYSGNPSKDNFSFSNQLRSLVSKDFKVFCFQSLAISLLASVITIIIIVIVVIVAFVVIVVIVIFVIIIIIIIIIIIKLCSLRTDFTYVAEE